MFCVRLSVLSLDFPRNAPRADPLWGHDYCSGLGWLGWKRRPSSRLHLQSNSSAGEICHGSDKHSSHPSFWFIHLICSLLPSSQTSTMLQLATKIFSPKEAYAKNSRTPFLLTPAGPNAQDWRIIWIWGFQGFSWDALAVTALVNSEGGYYTSEYMISTPKFWLQ